MTNSKQIGYSSQKAISYPNYIHLFHNRLYTVRPRVHEFLQKCFHMFDVGIWTYAVHQKMDALIAKILSPDEVSQLKFVKIQDKNILPHICKDKEKPVFLKDLSIIWTTILESGRDLHNYGYDSEDSRDSPTFAYAPYSDKNTILIDDTPYRAAANPSNTTLFPSIYEGGRNDKFLLGILWPLLEQMYNAIDTRLYLHLNEPKWSMRNAYEDEIRNATIYLELEREGYLKRPALERKCYDVLSTSKYEIPWDKKEVVSKMSSVDEMTEKEILEIAIDLGYEFSTEFKDDPRRFLETVELTRDNTTKYEKFGARDYCNRNIHVDRVGKFLTCSNKNCSKCLPVAYGKFLKTC